jgi:hypothetical protein
LFDKSDGNIAVAKGDARPKPRRVSKDQNARDLFAPFARRYHDLKNAHRASSSKSSIYARVAEHAHKLALVHHMSRFGLMGAGMEIEPASVEWAIWFAEMACRASLAGITDNVATSEYHGLEQKIMRLIRDRATPERPGLPKWELQRLAGLPVARLDDILSGLISSRQIAKTVKRVEKGAGRPAELFCVVSGGLKE